MTYSIFKDGKFMARFATREGALAYIYNSHDRTAEFEITDESDEL
jgi:hypothetical protein